MNGRRPLFIENLRTQRRLDPDPEKREEARKRLGHLGTKGNKSPVRKQNREKKKEIQEVFSFMRQRDRDQEFADMRHANGEDLYDD